MAFTRQSSTPTFFFSLWTLMLLSASQGVNSYASGESMPVNMGASSVSERFEITVSAELLKQWKEFYAIIREEEKTVQNLFRDATNAQFKAGTQLRSAEIKKDQMDLSLLADLQTAYDKSVNDLKIANLQQKEIKKLVEKSRKINGKPGSLTEKKVDGMRSAYNAYLAKYNPGRPPVEKPVVPPPISEPPPVVATTPIKPSTPATKPTQTEPAKETKSKTPPSKPTPTKPTTETKPTTQNNPTKENKPVQQTKPTTQTKSKSEVENKKEVTSPEPLMSYDPEMIDKRPTQSKSAKYQSQPFECIYETNKIDPANGLMLKALKPAILFTHTDPDLKPYFRGKDLITCLGRVSISGAYVQLTIEFQIASSHSQNNFGSLEEGSMLRFKLMNDEYISLFNLKTNMGHIDPYTGYTIFSGQYAMGKQEINKLSTVELDKMRVMWSTGFEDYDVYHVDFLINQLNCVMSK